LSFLDEGERDHGKKKSQRKEEDLCGRRGSSFAFGLKEKGGGVS